jgi:hypothetical protein
MLPWHRRLLSHRIAWRGSGSRHPDREMLGRSFPRIALPLVIAVGAHACNIYTEELFGQPSPPESQSGGTGAGGAAETGGTTGGNWTTGGVATGGMPSGSAGVAPTGGAANGGEPATGGIADSGGTGGSSLTGGTSGSGGLSAGGASGEGGVLASGGAPTGGNDPGGAGGVATGGAATGGAPTGGAPTGGAPTGGAPTGGMGTGGLPPGITAIDMLDVENHTIELSDGAGEWYVFHDGSTDGVVAPDTPRTTDDLVPVPLPSPRDESLLGVHVVANDLFTSWGAGLGFNLNSPDGTARLKYDVSPYTGIVFWGRSGSGSVTVRLKVITADIAPDTESGGECATNCNDAFGTPIALTTEWQQYPIAFADLAQQGWGTVPPGGFDPTGVLAVQLHADAGVAFDIWLDDVCFYE